MLASLDLIEGSERLDLSEMNTLILKMALRRIYKELSDLPKSVMVAV